MPSCPGKKQHVIPTGALEECDDILTDKIPQEIYEPEERPYEIVWFNVGFFIILHLVALYGLYAVFAKAKLLTTLYAIFLYHLGVFGVTGGAHRLWSHKSFKAKWPLKVVLVLCETLANQNSVIEWARDHRVHHKFQETDADPHNAKRGFFFAHMGWLLCKKHKEVKTKGKGIDLSDLFADPLLKLQHKYYSMLSPIVCYVLPTIIPMFLWNDTFINSYCLNVLRYVLSLHGIWFINSVAHLYGTKPYDKHINPTETYFVSAVASGEGWHNYHHTFPWDYKAAEFGRVNLTLTLINLFAKIGWAYDLKTVSKEMIKKRVERTGDGSHEIWGWGDKDQSPEDFKDAIIYNKKGD